MKDLLCFFNSLDERIWGENINTNKYFASISILLIAVLGAAQGGGTTLQSWFGWDMAMVLPSTVGLAVLIYGLNLYECIVAAGPKIAILRSLLLLVGFALVFAVSYLIAVVVLFAVAAVLIIWFVGALLSNGGASKRAVVTDEYGRKTDVEKNMFGDYQDSMGNTYKDNHDGTVTKE